MADSDLILVSNRGPITFDRDESGERTMRRGGGGLVSALTGLIKYRRALWIASAMTAEDAAVSAERGGASFDVELEDVAFRIKLVASDPVAYDRFYNVIANPFLWFIQHYLWDLSNAPDIRQEEVLAWDEGYRQVNADIANAVVAELEGRDKATVMLHDYHLYLAPATIRAARPDVLLAHFVHIPWTQSDAWLILPERIRREVFEGLLANDVIGFHTKGYCRRFMHCCRDLMGLEIDEEASTVTHEGRKVWVRAYPLPIDADGFREAARSPGVELREREILRRRRDHLILRVDRADLSKNVLRGFTAFDIFLDQRPEFREKVTFIAHMQPSRQDVPEYAEYLEKIEALVAVVNHRHGTTDWMPIDLRLHDDLDEAIAAYKHFDLLIVNSIFDGMNLVAKEGPLVNERNGVMLLSENTGAHEEIGAWCLSVNPFDVQQQADAIHKALTMPPTERAELAGGLKQIILARGPVDWINDQLEDLEAKGLEKYGKGRTPAL